MAILPRRDDEDFMVEINTTPLIDVMLVLLIMLIITIPVQTHAVRLDLPEPQAAASPERPKVVDLVIAADGAVSWNGAAVPTESALDDLLRAASRREPQPELHIKADPLARYEPVAKVLAAAQRVGVERLGFVGIERYSD
ncbi:MAG TPA: biopolymer transporter ExbD [Parvibaculum sp.]|uniref:ExbD/TolR family protein n=1 Tax=Parvibaculum sp. TaxID=2024848 RepID=UPI002CFF2125|nr:biopolymer transporter ExbD [Parvibaculum sp.]HMM15065.1 biopolymer transporter ExbD [Parvibaculum sp.]